MEPAAVDAVVVPEAGNSGRGDGSGGGDYVDVGSGDVTINYEAT